MGVETAMAPIPTMIVRTYALPQGVDPQLFARMAQTHGLCVVELQPAAISVTGSDGGHEIFADILDQLQRLCG